MGATGSWGRVGEGVRQLGGSKAALSPGGCGTVPCPRRSHERLGLDAG